MPWTLAGLAIVAVGALGLSLTAFHALAAQAAPGVLHEGGLLLPGIGVGGLLGAAAVWGATRRQVSQNTEGLQKLERTLEHLVRREDLDAVMEPVTDALDRLGGVETRMMEQFGRSIERLNDTEITRLRNHNHEMANRVARCEAILELRGLDAPGGIS